MAERVTDLRDIRDRVIAELSAACRSPAFAADIPSILCAEDLAPADTAGLDPKLVVALATTLGGPTSHTAIIAPSSWASRVVVAVDGLDARREQERWSSSTAPFGTVTVSPDHAAAGRPSAAAAQREAQQAAHWSGPGATADGHAVSVLANVQDGAAARAATAIRN